MKKILKILLSFLVLQGGLLFAEERIILKIATVAPANSPWDVELKKVAAEWNRITNGTVSIQFQNMTTLGGEKSAIQRMQARRPGQRAPLDGAVFTSIGLNELAPNAKIFTLSSPFLIRSQEALDLVIKNYGREIEAEYEKVGVQLLAWTNAGWLRFYTRGSYTSVDGLKKQRIACSSSDSSALSNALRVAGFNVKDIPVNKFSQSLKTGAFDGFYSVPMLAFYTGDYRSISYGLDTRLCPVMCGLVISTTSWEKIPVKYHADLKAVLARTIEKLNADLEKFDIEYTERMKKQGLQIITLDNAQVQSWGTTLNDDMRKAAAAYPNLFNINLYDRIKTALEKMQK